MLVKLFRSKTTDNLDCARSSSGRSASFARPSWGASTSTVAPTRPDVVLGPQLDDVAMTARAA